MFYVVLSLCAVICTFFFSRHQAVKTRLVEKNINEVIARKLLTSKHSVELNRLRDENGVMRNLIIDMVENEASLMGISDKTPAEEATRRVNARGQRRRELFAEAVVVLDRVKKPMVRIPHPAE